MALNMNVLTKEKVKKRRGSGRNQEGKKVKSASVRHARVIPRPHDRQALPHQIHEIVVVL